MANRNIGNLQATLSLNASGWNKGFKSALAPIKSFTDGIKSVGTVAAGVLTAGAISGVIDNIKNVGKAAFSTVSNMQRMEKQIQSLSAAEIVKASNGMMNYSDAIGAAGEMANETIDYIRNLSIVSPYSNQTVLSAFQMNAAMGQSVNQAKVTTKAILTLGAGMGMTEQEMSGFAAALAQTGATGRITAADLRQFANNRFGLDKMNAIFERMSKATKVNISTYEDFNKAVASGKVTTDDFYKALAKYAEQNYGGAVELMSNTLDGLESTMGDIKEYALGDMFKPFGDSFAKAFAPIVGGLADFLGVGGFKDFGEKIAKWAKPGLDAIEKFGKNITGKRIKQVLKDVQQYLGDTAKSGISLKAILEATFGEKAGGAIFGFFEKLRKPLAWINEHKDAIIGGIKGMAIAFGTLTVIGTVSGLLSALLNPLNLVLAAAGLLGAAWSTNFMGMRDKTQELIDKVRPIFEAITEYVKGLSKAFQSGGLSGVISKLKTDIVGLIPQSVINVWNNFNEIITKICNAIKAFLMPIFSALKQAFQNLSNGLGNSIGLLKTSWENIKGMFENILPTLTAVAGIIGAITALIGSLVTGIITGFIQAIDNVINAVINLFNGLVSIISGVFQIINGVFEVLKGIFTSNTETIMNGLLYIANGFGKIIYGLISGVIGTLGHLLIAVWDFFSRLFSGIAAFFTGLWANISEPVMNVVNGVVEAFRGWWDKIKTFVQEIWGGIVEWFTNLWNELVGHSIVPDMIQDVVNAFSGWWGKLKQFVIDIYNGVVQWFLNLKTRILGVAKQVIANVKNGFVEKWESVVEWGLGLVDIVKGWFEGIDLIESAKKIIDSFFAGLKEKWEEVKKWATDAWESVKGWFGGGGEETLEAGTATTEVTNMVAIDAFSGVPQAVLDSFEALNQKILALNLSIPILNLNLGAASGLLFALTSVATYLSGDATAAFTEFATFVSIGGTFGLALDTLIKMFSLDGGLGLKQTMTQVAEYMAGDFTTTFTNFGTFISIGGTFGDALDKLIKTLSQDGNASSLKQTMEKVADYIKGTWTNRFKDFEKHLNEKTMPTYEALSKLLYYGTNTVYNAYGNVLGVLESIYKVLGDISNRLRGSFKRALDDSIDPMGKFEGAAQNVATVCSNIAAQATAAAMAIADLINQMSALDGVDLPSAGGGKKGGGKPKSNESARAKGGPVSGGTTYLVGERGPELFTPRRSGWIIPNDEAFGDNGASGGKQTILNINAPIYGEDHLRQLIRSEIKRGLREAEFHGIA